MLLVDDDELLLTGRRRAEGRNRRIQLSDGAWPCGDLGASKV